MLKNIINETKLVASYSFGSGYIKYSLYVALKENVKKSNEPMDQGAHPDVS